MLGAHVTTALVWDCPNDASVSHNVTQIKVHCLHHTYIYKYVNRAGLAGTCSTRPLLTLNRKQFRWLTKLAAGLGHLERAVGPVCDIPRVNYTSFVRKRRSYYVWGMCVCVCVWGGYGRRSGSLTQTWESPAYAAYPVSTQLCTHLGTSCRIDVHMIETGPAYLHGMISLCCMMEAACMVGPAPRAARLQTRFLAPHACPPALPAREALNILLIKLLYTNRRARRLAILVSVLPRQIHHDVVVLGSVVPRHQLNPNVCKCYTDYRI